MTPERNPTWVESDAQLSQMELLLADRMWVTSLVGGSVVEAILAGSCGQGWTRDVLPHKRDWANGGLERGNVTRVEGGVTGGW